MRVHNFNAGPGVLPETVLRQAQRDILDIGGSGIGIMEHSHRGELYEAINAEAEALVRELASVPEGYRVLFVQGGATQQFAMVPMNLLTAGRTADYLVTGAWARRAEKEAQLFGGTHVAVTGEPSRFAEIPPIGAIRYSGDPAYVHFTTNNTIFGTQWREEPPVPDGVPLVADASSDIFSRPIDVRKYGLIYAGAQKNLGPSGVVLVIVREDLLDRVPATVPSMMQYRVHAAEKSLYNTPPTMAVYMVGRVLDWIKQAGGLAGMEARNREKAALLYDTIDRSSFFRGTAAPADRSLMNVCFRAPTEELETAFCTEATSRGLIGLKGHRSVGGMRASIYNACPRESVAALVEFMEEFAARHSA